MKVIVAPTISEPVPVRKVPCNTVSLPDPVTLTVRVVGVGAVDGGGVVNPDDPVTVFDELKLHVLPAVQFWLFTR